MAAEPVGSFAQVVARVQPKVVKIYGAGGVAGLDAYQTGCLVSATGHILTVRSTVLDTDSLDVTLLDGRKFSAQLVGIAPRMDLAMLKIDGQDFDFFDLSQASEAKTGTRVLAFSNLFQVAQGNEPVSVQHGWIASNTTLHARRGVHATAYRGAVYVLDTITNNPGAAGGVLTNQQGEFLGLLGKELRNALNNTWLNYALPASQLTAAVEEMKSGRQVATNDELRIRPEQPLRLSDLGLALVPDILAKTPPYVDVVRAGSPAALVGLRPDDLIVFFNGRMVQSCKSLKSELQFVESDAEVELTLLRGQDLVEVKLRIPSEP